MVYVGESESLRGCRVEKVRLYAASYERQQTRGSLGARVPTPTADVGLNPCRCLQPTIHYNMASVTDISLGTSPVYYQIEMSDLKNKAQELVCRGLIQVGFSSLL